MMSDATNLSLCDFSEYNSLAKELVHSTNVNIGTFLLVREEVANDSFLSCTDLDSPIF